MSEIFLGDTHPSQRTGSDILTGTNQIDHVIYSREESPFGKTWEQWTADWWKWVLSLPIQVNPGVDETGEKFVINNSELPVIFLVGTFGGNAERNCSVDYGKSLFFPIINFSTSYLEEPELKSDWELCRRAKLDIDDISQKYLSIDGHVISNLDRFRVQSDVFDAYYPENNVFHAPKGNTRAISDGYWVFLKPLPVGIHEIHVNGACSLGKTKIDVVWHLMVKKAI